MSRTEKIQQYGKKSCGGQGSTLEQYGKKVEGKKKS
jgi:hypothetical protein